MTLITLDELARAGIIITFGSAAGGAAMVAPNTLLWTAPALAGAALMSCTVPEVREELRQARPLLTQARQQLAARFRPEDAAAPQTAPADKKALTAPPLATSATAAPLRSRQWLQAVNDLPDDNPHMTVVGPSGTGKTTFVSAALGQRPGRVVVLTPKVSPGAWRGAEVVTLDDDLSYQPLADALGELQMEARRRSAALRRGEPLEPMTVVLDELPELVAEIPGAGKFAVRLSRWGRELHMRQVVIATSDEALSIPGWAATRPNYVRVELGKPTEDGTRPAWLDDGQSRRQLDLSTVQAGAQRAQLRPWRQDTPVSTLVSKPVSPVSTPVTDLLAILLAESVPPHQDDQGTPVNPVPGNGSNGAGGHSSVIVEGGAGGGVTVNTTFIAPQPAAKERTASTAYERALVEVYRALGAEGLTFAKAYARHKGTKEIVFTAWQEGRTNQKEN